MLKKFVHAQIMELESITYRFKVLSSDEYTKLCQFYAFAEDHCHYNIVQDVVLDLTPEEWMRIGYRKYQSYVQEMYHHAK